MGGAKGRGKGGKQSARAKAHKARMQSTLELLRMLMDPEFHVRVQCAYMMTVKLRSACVQLQTDNMSPSVLAAIEGAYEDFTKYLSDDARPKELAPARILLTSALNVQPDLGLVANVVTSASGVIIVSNVGDFPPVVLKRIEGVNDGARKAAEQKKWDVLVAGKQGPRPFLSVVEEAANDVTRVYNSYVVPLFNFASQRNLASLYACDLNSIKFVEMLEQVTAMPMKEEGGPDWTWNPAVGKPPVGEDAVLAEGEEYKKDVGERLGVQFVDYKAQGILKNLAGGGVNILFVTEADRATTPAAARYWIRTRHRWPDLSELMLFWLSIPVSTAGLERGFSFQTLLDQNTRRRSRKAKCTRDEMLAMIHRKWLAGTLEGSIASF